MNVIFVLIIISIIVATAFLALFLWASRSGQYDDTTTPSMRMLFDDRPSSKPIDHNQKSR